MVKYLFLLVLVLLVPIASLAEEVRVGVTIPLTGAFASYGVLIRKGVELASQDLRKQGKELKVIYEDACMPAEAVTAIKKLSTSDKIDILAANFCVIAIPPMAPTIEKGKIIAFHTASASDSILDSGRYIFTTNIKVQSEARHLAEYAFNELGARTASILYISSDFGEDYNKHFKVRFEELGGKILSSDIGRIGIYDFRAELIRIKAKNPDVVFAAHLGAALGTLLRQARDTGLDKQFLGVYEAEDPSVLKTAKKAAEGLLFFVPEPLERTQTVKRFRAAFESKFGHAPRILASNAYDAVMIAVNSFVECKRDPDCAKSKIYSIREYDGVSGRFSIDPDGGTKKGFVLKTVKNGRFERVSSKHSLPESHGPAS